MSSLSLGQTTEYPEEYAPGVLFPIARAEARGELGLGASLPFRGVDVWNAWELTWLDPAGRPVVATATITVDAASPNIVESKSMKLYLGSFAMSRYETAAEVSALIAKDLSAVAGTPVSVDVSPGPGGALARVDEMPGICIDDLEFTGLADEVNADLLEVATDKHTAATLHTHLLRSLCPVTNQPDFGSLLVAYEGPLIEPASLLAYVTSYRRHNGFHEACVERMFVDIHERCSPDALTIYARYTRRGGIDINPWRSSADGSPDNLRLWRQ